MAEITNNTDSSETFAQQAFHTNPSEKKTFLNGIINEKAEEQVVNIILSAIVGNIIESWELITLEDDFKSTDGLSYMTRSEVTVFNDESNCYVESGSHELNVDSELRKSGKDSNIHSNKLSFDISGQSFKQNIDPDKSLQNEEFSASTSLSIIRSEQKVKIYQLLKSLLEGEKEKIFHCKFLESNVPVSIVFKNGNKYEGSISKCRMHGQGKFTWRDGSVYTGAFSNGEMTGTGCLQWPDQSWYEGEFVQGFRNGVGLFVQNSTFYVGNWKCGMRHGLGTMYYMQRDTSVNYYNGEWCQDKKEGTGLRSYRSGAMYSGEWHQGVRHGLGTMVWTNNDVYSGQWNKGEIHGYGEYTWDTFFNQQLVVPQENCFFGEWARGLRQGKGTLETSLGVTIRGTWNHGKKHGPAEVICCNGNLIYADNLFFEDNISFKQESLSEADSLMDTAELSSQLYNVPVNTANQNIDLTLYVERLYISNPSNKEKIFFKSMLMNDVLNSSQKSLSKILELNKRTHSHNKSFESYREENEQEESLLRNIILQYLPTLRMLYTTYSELCCETKPNFASTLMRFMLWQMMRDCKLHNRGVSLAHFDIIVANNKVILVQSVHYPFERLHFWQFLHCIIEISWVLYGRYGNGTSNVQGVLASALHKLITSDILPNVGRHKGNALFKYKNLLSLDSVYWLYKRVGEPHSARKLLKAIMAGLQPNKDKYTSATFEYPEHVIHGKNVVGVVGELAYRSSCNFLSPTVKRYIASEQPTDLTRLCSIGLLAVFECIQEICPGIHFNNTIVDMDYEIIFLEFYEILLLCAKRYVQMNNTSKIKQEILEEEDTDEKLNINAYVEQDKETSSKEFPVKETTSKSNKTKKLQKPKKKNQKKQA